MNDEIVIWQKLYANSQLFFYVDNHIFHYEIYLRGIQQNTSEGIIYQSTSKIKFCVSRFEYKGDLYHFILNPINKTAKCSECSDIVIPWRVANYTNLVLRKEELNFEEQLNKHLRALESHVSRCVIPKIEVVFNQKLKSKR